MRRGRRRDRQRRTQRRKKGAPPCLTWGCSQCRSAKGRSAFATPRLVNRGSGEPFQERFLGREITDKMFSLAGWLQEAITSRKDQQLVQSRVINFMIGTRRGRLRLPEYLPSEVRALSNMTKSQVRNCVYYVKPQNADGLILPEYLSTYIREVMPHGCVRTVHGCPTVHEWQRKVVRPLPESDWPRLGTRSAWPSTPTITELLEMSRRGLSPLPLRTNRYKMKHFVSMAQFNSDAGLCRSVVTTNVVGIRSDIKVPGNYLDYFSYRWGFLILDVRHAEIPIGLCRFLAGQWIRSPCNLWLQDKCPLRRFLREVPSTRFSSREAMVGPW